MTVREKIRKFGWRVAVAVLLLGWIFHSIFLNEGRSAWEREGQNWEQLSRADQWRAGWVHGPAELWATLTQVRLDAFVLSLGFFGLTILLGIIRWRKVLQTQGLELPFKRAAGISFVAHFFNSFLLGSTGGDLMKAYYAARETHHKKTEAVVTVFVDRGIGLWSMLFFAALMIAPNIALVLNHDRLAALSLVVVAILGALSALLALAFWGGVSRRWPQARAGLKRLPKGELLERSLEACRQLGRNRLLLPELIGLSMAINAAAVLHVLFLAWGLGLSISPLALCVIVPVIIFFSAMPITPSGLGVRENLFVLILAVPAIGVPATSALSLSLLVYAGGLVWSLIGGIAYLFLKQREHLEEVTEQEELAEEAA